MNSRQRRMIEAQQHNDEIAYADWLIKNTAHQTRRAEVSEYKKAVKAGLSRRSALVLGAAISLISQSSISASVRE